MVVLGMDDLPSPRRVQAHRETPRVSPQRSKHFFSLELNMCPIDRIQRVEREPVSRGETPTLMRLELPMVTAGPQISQLQRMPMRSPSRTGGSTTHDASNQGSFHRFYPCLYTALTEY